MITLINILEINIKLVPKENEIRLIAKMDATFKMSPIDAIKGEETLSGSNPFLNERMATRIVVKIRPIAAAKDANKEIKKRCIKPIVWFPKRIPPIIAKKAITAAIKTV